MSFPEPLPTPRRFEDEFRAAVRVRGYSMDTEKAYWMWTRQFILHHGKRHSRELGVGEATTMICTHVMKHPGLGVKSPLD